MPPKYLVLGAFVSLSLVLCLSGSADAVQIEHFRSTQQIRLNDAAEVLPRAVLANQPAPTASWIAPPVKLPPPAEIPSAPAAATPPAAGNATEECEQCGCSDKNAGPKMVDGTCKHHRFPYKQNPRAELKDLEDQHAADDAAAKKTQQTNTTFVNGNQVISSNAFVLEPNAVKNLADGSVVVPTYNYHASNLPTIPAPPQPAPARVQSSTLPSKTAPTAAAQAPPSPNTAAPVPAAPVSSVAGALQPAAAPATQTVANAPKAPALLETSHIMLGTDGPEDLSDLVRQSKISFTPMQDWEKARAVRTFADADQYELFEAAKEHRKPFWEIKIPTLLSAAPAKQPNATEIIAAAAGVDVGAQVTKKRRKIIKIIQRRRTHISDELINDPRVKKIIAENPEEAKWTNDVVDIQGNVVPVGDNGTIAVAVDAPDAPAPAAPAVIPGISPRFRAMIDHPEEIPKWGPKGAFNPLTEEEQVRVAISKLDFTPREGVPRWTQSPGHKMYETPQPTPEELKMQKLEALVSASAQAAAQVESSQRFMQIQTTQAAGPAPAEAEVEGEMSLSDGSF